MRLWKVQTKFNKRVSIFKGLLKEYAIIFFTKRFKIVHAHLFFYFVVFLGILLLIN